MAEANEGATPESEQPEPPRRKVGRPLKFATVQALQQKIAEYFGSREPHKAKRSVWVEKSNPGEGYWAEQDYITDQLPITITGLAYALETSRKVLLDYESGMHDNPDLTDDITAQFSNTVTRAKLRCEAYAEDHLFMGKTPAGAVFSLKNNYSWVDKSEVEHSGNVTDDLDAIDEAELAREEASVAAAAEIAKIEGKKDDKPGPAAQEQVVQADAPVQDQG